jgi:hypothetical protein
LLTFVLKVIVNIYNIYLILHELSVSESAELTLLFYEAHFLFLVKGNTSAVLVIIISHIPLTRYRY